MESINKKLDRQLPEIRKIRREFDTQNKELATASPEISAIRDEGERLRRIRKEVLRKIRPYQQIKNNLEYYLQIQETQMNKEPTTYHSEDTHGMQKAAEIRDKILQEIAFLDSRIEELSKAN